MFFLMEGVPKGTPRHVAILQIGVLIFKRLKKQVVAPCWAPSPLIFGGPLAPQCVTENDTDSAKHLISLHNPLRGAGISMLQTVKETQATEVR